MKILRYLGFMIFAMSGAMAQKAPQPLKLNLTPNGIFVECGRIDLVGKSLELQRKKAGETAFKTIARLSPPGEIGLVRSKIAEAAGIFEEGARPSETGLENIWQKYQAKDKQMYGAISILPQLQYIFGLAYLDKETRPGEKYQYQLMEGRTVLMATKFPFEYRKLRRFPVLQNLSSTKLNKSVVLECNYPVQWFQTTVFQVSRKNISQETSEYRRIKPAVSLQKDPKKSGIVITDTLLDSYGEYNYQVKLSDIFGNKDTAVYYFEGQNIPQLAGPEVFNVKIEPVKDERFVNISWDLTSKDIVQNVTLYRSREFDGKYEAVSRFNKDELSYKDQIQVANELYFYYFEVSDVFGNVKKTIKYQNVYEGKYVPTAPLNLDLVAGPAGPALSWVSSDQKTRGFYVFRKKDLDGEFAQVSPILLIRDGKGSFTDTTRLNPESYYFYAVKSESDTYDKSGFSDTVSYRPAATEKTGLLKPPYDINVVFRDNKAKITWENVNDTSPDVLGYQVYRKSESEKEYKLITPRPLPFYHNYWSDSLLTSALKFQYVVVSTDGKEHFSPKSTPVELDLNGMFVMVPDEVGYEMDPKGITLKWTEVDTDRLKSIRIYRAEDDGQIKLITTLDRKLRKFKDITVKKGKSYIYVLSTVDLNGKEGNRTEPLLLNF